MTQNTPYISTEAKTPAARQTDDVSSKGGRAHAPFLRPISDLGENIGSRHWWRHLLVCSVGLGVLLTIGLTAAPALPEAPQAVPAPETVLSAGAEAGTAEIGASSPDFAESKADLTNTHGHSSDPVASQESDVPGAFANEIAPKPVAITLKKGQTLVQALRRAGISNGEAHKAATALARHVDMRRIQTGQRLSLSTTKDSPDKIHSLTIRDRFSREVSIASDKAGFNVTTTPVPTLELTRYAEAEITDSLFLAADRAGVPAAITVELIRLFSFDVDFQREIWPGDGFAVYFDRTMAPEYDDIQEGRILYARLKLRNRTLELTRFTDGNGQVDYFDASGKSVRKALMKTPIDGARLSSRFGNRKHPVLGYKRKHKGVDFSAPTGTPIMAAGDGVVERASRYGSFGNYVRIRHNSSYKTAYAHMSKYGRGIKAGKRVRQGQIIGYVGATGRVTGRHLHYEVFFNGKAINPLTMKLPTGKQLKGPELASFQKRHQDLAADIGTARQFEQARLLALATTDNSAAAAE